MRGSSILRRLPFLITTFFCVGRNSCSSFKSSRASRPRLCVARRTNHFFRAFSRKRFCTSANSSPPVPKRVFSTDTPLCKSVPSDWFSTSGRTSGVTPMSMSGALGLLGDQLYNVVLIIVQPSRVKRMIILMDATRASNYLYRMGTMYACLFVFSTPKKDARHSA